jgi:transposase InsO family protein
VRQLCRLFKVNRAWYYERQKLRAEREKEESELKSTVEKLLLEFNGYGYRRVTKALQRQGWNINHKKVLRLLRKWGLLCRPLRPSKKKLATTISAPKASYTENLLKKHAAELAGVNRAWLGEVVLVITKKEKGYLASLLDRYSRRGVGWAVSAINDTALTLKGLNRAIAERQPEVGLIHHTDHGPCLYQW